MERCDVWEHCLEAQRKSIFLSLANRIDAGRQNEIFAAHSNTFGAMYCPIILGSDKTTVSKATGQVEYHPLYLSIGNPHNSVRRAHRNAVIPIAFLAIPKSESPCSVVLNTDKFMTFQVAGGMTTVPIFGSSNDSFTIRPLRQFSTHYAKA